MNFAPPKYYRCLLAITHHFVITLTTSTDYYFYPSILSLALGVAMALEVVNDLELDLS